MTEDHPVLPYYSSQSLANFSRKTLSCGHCGVAQEAQAQVLVQQKSDLHGSRMSLTCHQTSRIVKSELLPGVHTGLEQLRGGCSNQNSSTGVDKL